MFDFYVSFIYHNIDPSNREIIIKPITISGKDNDDARHYQEKAIHLAIE